MTLTIVDVGMNTFPNGRPPRKTREGGAQRVFQQGDAYEYPNLVKSAYRTFCAEVKVVVEIATIATYGGLMPRKRMSLRWANGAQP